MKKTAFKASTPVLHLPVRSLLQTALLFFLSFLFALLGQFFALPEACKWGNTSSSSSAPQMNGEGQFLLSLAHLRSRMMERRGGKGEKQTRTPKGRAKRAEPPPSSWAICSPAELWEGCELSARMRENADFAASWSTPDSLLQASGHPGRLLPVKGRNFKVRTFGNYLAIAFILSKTRKPENNLAQKRTFSQNQAN